MPSAVATEPRTVPATAPPRVRRRRWSAFQARPSLITKKHALGALAAIVLAVLACSWAWIDAYSFVYATSSNIHILLVPPIVILLVWARRLRLARARVTATAVGPLLIGLGWLLFIIGPRYEVASFFHFGALLVAVGAAACVIGGGVFVRLLPATFALLFIVPIPGVVRNSVSTAIDPLIDAAAVANYEALGGKTTKEGATRAVWRPDGSPQLLEERDLVFHIPTLLSTLTVTYGLAFLLPLRGRYRLILLSLAVVIALAASHLRSLAILIAAGRLDDAGFAATRIVSSYTAWITVPLALALLLLVVRLFRHYGMSLGRYRMVEGQPDDAVFATTQP